MVRVSLGARFALALAALATVFGGLTWFGVHEVIHRAIPGGPSSVAINRAVGLFVTVNTLLLISFALILFNRVVARPLRSLAGRADHAALDMAPFDLGGGARDEMGELSASLGRMTARLREDRDRIAAQLAELTEKTRALEAAQQQLVRAEKLAMVGRLSAGIAHEVGTPLGTVLGYIDMLRKDLAGRATPEELEFLGRIEGEVNRINRIVRELLDYSRPASFKIESIDLAKVVADVVALLEPQKGFKALTVALDLGAGAVWVRSDVDRLRQVLMNLLFNASDAMAGKGRIAVTATEDRVAGEVALSIADAGTGMTREELDKIFEPFYTTKVPGHGTGLGLAVSQRLVESMGGRIEVASEPDRGSTFTVCLKMADGRADR